MVVTRLLVSVGLSVGLLGMGIDVIDRWYRIGCLGLVIIPGVVELNRLPRTVEIANTWQNVQGNNSRRSSHELFIDCLDM